MAAAAITRATREFSLPAGAGPSTLVVLPKGGCGIGVFRRQETPGPADLEVSLPTPSQVYRQHGAIAMPKVCRGIWWW